jgi:predicted nucleic acid-binding protein
VAPDLASADTASRIRAQYGFRTPGALQAATAIRGGATAVMSDDAGIARLSEIEIGVLARLRSLECAAQKSPLTAARLA